MLGILERERLEMGLGWRIILFLVLFGVVGGLVSLIPIPGLLGRTLPMLVGALLAGWFLLVRVEGRGPGALGFYLAPPAPLEVVKGLGLGLVVGGVVILGMALRGAVRWEAQDGSVGTWLLGALLALGLFAVPAAAEEALLRGYPLQVLARERGQMVALWGTSLFFALLHLGNPNLSRLGLANLLLAGLFLGVVYLKTASLWWATGAHLGWNWTMGFLADLPVSGLDLVDAPLLEPTVQGAEWITGGAFGPEGSSLATVVLALAALVLWKSSWLKPGSAAMESRPLILSGAGHDPGPEEGEGTFKTDEFGRMS